MSILFTDKKLWILLAVLIVLRLPSLNRPVSKHHEFNTAVILINAESWNEAGGGKQFCYTPLLNYQGSSNHLLDKGWHIDKKGNHVYLSFGAGWYVLPYFLFKATGIPFTPLSLRLLNIIIGLLTAVLLYILLLKATNKNAALAGTGLFVCMPAPLWYTGIAYVTTAIMLPIVVVILLLWQSFETSVKQINFKYLSYLFFAGIALCYFDWLAVFLLAAMAVWALFQAKNNRRYLWISMVSAGSILAGILFVLFQFAGYLGWEQVLHYWQARFSDRSTDTSQHSAGVMLLYVLQNLASGYLPIFLLLPFIWKRNSFIKETRYPSWPLWALAAIIPYNGIFFNWSAGHEFAWMAFGLLATVAVTVYLLPSLSLPQLKKIVIPVLFLSLIQYYLINPPGPANLKGDRYDEQKFLGEWISKNVDRSVPVFININNDKIVEYYSKRTFNSAQSPSEAKALADLYKIKEALWIEVEKGKVKKVVRLFSPL
jgi:hypothetical protein